MNSVATNFPDKVWDGLCYQYTSLDVDKHPDFFWKDQATQEIIAIENCLFESFVIKNEFTESAFEGDVVASYQDIFLLGNSDIYSRTQVVGLANEFIPAGSSGRIQSIGIKTLENWHRLIGTEFLEPGKVYFLDNENGKMTSSIPTTGWLVKIGFALTETRFFINPQFSIKL